VSADAHIPAIVHATVAKNANSFFSAPANSGDNSAFPASASTRTTAGDIPSAVRSRIAPPRIAAPEFPPRPGGIPSAQTAFADGDFSFFAAPAHASAAAQAASANSGGNFSFSPAPARIADADTPLSHIVASAAVYTPASAVISTPPGHIPSGEAFVNIPAPKSPADSGSNSPASAQIPTATAVTHPPAARAPYTSANISPQPFDYIPAPTATAAAVPIAVHTFTPAQELPLRPAHIPSAQAASAASDFSFFPAPARIPAASQPFSQISQDSAHPAPEAAYSPGLRRLSGCTNQPPFPDSAVSPEAAYPLVLRRLDYTNQPPLPDTESRLAERRSAYIPSAPTHIPDSPASTETAELARLRRIEANYERDKAMLAREQSAPRNSAPAHKAGTLPRSETHTAGRAWETSAPEESDSAAIKRMSGKFGKLIKDKLHESL
jgi:hypothetical protein